MAFMPQLPAPEQSTISIIYNEVNMKKLILILLLIPTISFATLLSKDGNGNIVQGAAPDGLLSQTLTINSATIDMSSNLWWGLYAPTACKVRLMPTTAKGAYPTFTAPVNTLTQRYINRNTPFVNFSGCTSGELQRH
jgi:hypothetical protein